ncbi:hypothetical protein AVEN_257146-1 [Araneus ventricosus]|uniref:Uncharacterized protein n=1 Tax=Araneus ventricosus TaxID=182803 RepID=A0A4Y2WXS8_ARAVE|nr:hypothetical protein AVEN_257146-1 [Araneus ventricosus]
MTRTTPELAPPLQASAPFQREDVWPLRMIWRAPGPIHGGSSVELGFEPAALRSGGRGLATRPPRPPTFRVLKLSLQGSCSPRDKRFARCYSFSCVVALL